MAVLDSEFPTRVHEFDLWLGAARPGAVVVVHDAVNEHGPDTPQYAMGQRVAESGLNGVFLLNPRKASLGWPALPRELTHERERTAHLEGELAGIRSSRAYRLIGLRGRIRRSIRGGLWHQSDQT